MTKPAGDVLWETGSGLQLCRGVVVHAKLLCWGCFQFLPDKALQPSREEEGDVTRPSKKFGVFSTLCTRGSGSRAGGSSSPPPPTLRLPAPPASPWEDAPATVEARAPSCSRKGSLL